jgi:peroxisomal membrane protein 4
VLYLLSRVLAGLLKTAYQRARLAEWPLGPAFLAAEFPLKAAVCWGLVMWLFSHHPHNLQASLRTSMTYLYKDSEHWTSLRDLLLVNKSE